MQRSLAVGMVCSSQAASLSQEHAATPLQAVRLSVHVFSGPGIANHAAVPCIMHSFDGILTLQEPL